MVHPVSFDLAKLLWTPFGGATPAAPLQFLHLVHTVFDEAVQALDTYVPLAQTEQVAHRVSLLPLHLATSYCPALQVRHLLQTALADFEQTRDMRCPEGQLEVHREQIALFDPEQVLDEYYPEEQTEQFEQTEFCDPEQPPLRYWPDLQVEQFVQTEF